MERKQLKKQDVGQEDIISSKIETEEIDYDLDSDLELENDYNLIKYEFNLIELPFFTKDKKIEKDRGRKYTFSKKDNSYMRVVPSGDPDLISNKIPQEFDEKIFYGILRLSREQKGQEVVTDYYTLAKASGVPYNKLSRIKDSLERLSNCKVELHNLVYNAELKKKIAGKEPFPILQHVLTYTFDDVVHLPEEIKEKYKNYFRNSKINEILVIEFGSFMYRNLKKKGFLYFDQKKLLGISNATARKIYVMITKWKGWEKKNDIKRSCRFLASRIPLSWEKNSIRKTVQSIDHSCNILKESGLIDNYILEKTKPVGNSSVIFIFSNEYTKIDNYNTKASRTSTGHEEIIINNVEDEYVDERQTTVFDNLNKKETELKEKAVQILNSLDEKEKTLFINRARNHMQYDFLKQEVEQKTITEEERLNKVIISIIKKDIEDGIL